MITHPGIFRIVVAAGVVWGAITSHACLWDSDTLFQEKWKSPDLAKVILGQNVEKVDAPRLHDRIAKLKASPREDDPAWWNDLAGAHLRLGEPKVAADILEKIMDRFPDDYGVHANLGTAYHLLGRYEEAEKEIARDLEINPDAHFGLEKYHLALLQYLIRDAKYQSRHVYVDEFTAHFLTARGGPFRFTKSSERFHQSLAKDFTNNIAKAEAVYELTLETDQKDYRLGQALGTVAALDVPPDYREKWNLAEDSKLKEGVIYMASLNPKEPACFQMLGIIAWKNGDLNLAAHAFEKAIALGSPQSTILQQKIAGLREHIEKAHSYAFPFRLISGILVIVFFSIGALGWSKFRAKRRMARLEIATPRD